MLINSAWISKYFSKKFIKLFATTDNSLGQVLDFSDTIIKVKFDGNCLKQRKITFTHKSVLNLYICMLFMK